MVWGMILPSTFGEFWPLGHFEGEVLPSGDGWGERLRTYYRRQTPQEQKRLFDKGDGSGGASYPYYVSQKLKRETGTKLSADLPAFTPVEDHEPPQSFETERRCNALGSLIMLNSMILAVDDPLKAIIQDLEPMKHQFFPIDIVMPNGDSFSRSFYVVFVGQYIDSFSPGDSSESSWVPDGPEHFQYKENKAGITGLCLKKSIFGSAQLWRERRFHQPLVCFSDELQAKIADVGLRIPKHYRMMEV